MAGFTKSAIHRPLLWIIILFLIVPWLAFPEIIFGGQTLYWSDLSWIHYPRHIFAAQEWLAGRIPLWDPYQHNGLPFLAETQVGALYPFSLLFLSSLSPSLELSLFILLHFSLAAIFTFILARSLGLAWAPATVAALAFGYGGFLMAQVPNLNIMTGAVWLPLILYGIIQTTRHRTWLVALLAGIPLAFQILTAQPQIVFYTLVTICGYAVYRLLADIFSPPTHQHETVLYATHTVLLLSVAVLSGLLLAAPQLLPTLELQQLSVRSQERGFEFLTRNSLPPAMGLNLLLPSAFGNNVVGFKAGDPFQEDFIYIGFIPLLLTFVCLGQKTRRDMPFFLLLLGGGIFMALGRYTPLYQYVIQYLPGFSLFRIPARWLMVVNLALAVLAGFGLQTVLVKGISKSKLILVLASGLLLIAGLGITWFFRNDFPNWAGNWSDLHQKLLAAFLKHGFSINSAYQDRLLWGRLTFLTVPAFLLVTNIVIAGGLFMLWASRKLGANTFSLLVSVAIAIDLIVAGGTTINPTQPNSWWHRLSGGAQYVLENVGQARVFPLGMGSERATVSHLGQYFPSVYRVRSAGGHGSSLFLDRTITFLKKAHPVQAVQVLGVRYLLTEGQMGADTAATYPLVYSDEGSYVYENRSPLPRAFVVHEAVQADHPEEALAYFENNNLNPAQTVVLETEAGPLPLPEPATGSTAKIVAETPLVIDIAVEANAAGYLVLLDTFYPGWVATIDGQPAPIQRANYVGRAVFVPVGQHTVRFQYQPLAFRVGIWLAVFALVILIVVVLIGPRPLE